MITYMLCIEYKKCNSVYKVLFLQFLHNVIITLNSKWLVKRANKLSCAFFTQGPTYLDRADDPTIRMDPKMYKRQAETLTLVPTPMAPPLSIRPQAWHHHPPAASRPPLPAASPPPPPSPILHLLLRCTSTLLALHNPHPCEVSTTA